MPQTQTQLQNLYHRRLVAPAAAKPCFICHKPSTTVLITPDNRDFFFACIGHLKDRGFASPAEETKKEDAGKTKGEGWLEKEVENVKREYEDKMKRRKEKKSAREKDREKEKVEQDKKDEEDKKDEKDRDDKIKSLESQAAKTSASTDKEKERSEPALDETPRIFTLHKYVVRLRHNSGINWALWPMWISAHVADKTWTGIYTRCAWTGSGPRRWREGTERGSGAPPCSRMCRGIYDAQLRWEYVRTRRPCCKEMAFPPPVGITERPRGWHHDHPSTQPRLRTCEHSGSSSHIDPVRATEGQKSSGQSRKVAAVMWKMHDNGSEMAKGLK